MREAFVSLALMVATLVPISEIHPQSPGGPSLTPQAAFERLKTLSGDWEGPSPEGKEGEKIQVSYRVVANGSTLVETEFPGTPHEMLTVYHLDGENLMMTHYCAIGNQPRMVMEKGSTPQEIRFAFAGGTNLRPEVDTHMHSLRVRFIDEGTIESIWTHFEAGKESEPYTFHLTREP